MNPPSVVCWTDVAANPSVLVPVNVRAQAEFDPRAGVALAAGNKKRASMSKRASLNDLKLLSQFDWLCES